MQMITMRRALAAVAGVALAAVASGVAAQAFPSKPLKITSAYASGTGPDVFARLIAEKLSRAFGQPVIVEARPGGNGVIAIESVKKSAADGHDLLLAGGGHLVINPILNRSLPYDTEADFAAVSVVFQAPSFVAVATGGPYNTMADIVAAARRAPGKVAVGTQYLGSQQHLAGVMVEMLSNTKMLHVPFKEVGQLYTALINGDIAWTLATRASADPFVKSGKVKLIAHTAKAKQASHPGMPSMEEAGVGAMDLSVWAGLVAPRATSPERIAILSTAINKAIAEPDFQERARAVGLVLEPHRPSDFAEMIRSDIKVYGDIVRRGNVKVE